MAVSLVIVFIVALFSGATAAVIGFGIGSLLTPLLLSRLSPNVAIAVVALPHLLATALRYWQHRAAVDTRVLRSFGIPSAIGGLAGAFLLSRLKTPFVLVLLGILLVMTGAMNLFAPLEKSKPGRGLAIVFGALSGLFGGVAGNQGGLRAAGLTAFDLPPRVFLATSTATALLVDLARTPVYLADAYAELRPFIVLIAVAAAGCLCGTVLGERLFLRIPAQRYRKIVAVAVGAVGLWLLWTGVW